MAVPKRKILSPVVEPTIPLERIREAVRIVAAETRKRAEAEARESRQADKISQGLRKNA